MTETVSFRPATPSDLERLAQIAKNTDPWGWSLEQFKGSIATGDIVLICLKDGESSGFSILRQVLDEAELLDIAIDSVFQGQGLGRKLLSEALKTVKLRGVRTVHLEVRESNVRARNLYSTSGFSEVGKRPKYYPSEQGREDAVLMRLDM